MPSPDRFASSGSRTAAYVVCGVLATLPALILLAAYFGRAVGIGGVITVWLIGLVWILKRRGEDPEWDRRLPKREGH